VGQAVRLISKENKIIPMKTIAVRDPKTGKMNTYTINAHGSIMGPGGLIPLQVIMAANGIRRTAQQDAMKQARERTQRMLKQR
jgi:hypothetical protein